MTRTATATTTDFAIVFPEGLVGCQDWKRFVLMVDDDTAGDLPVAVLQSLDDDSVSLFVTDPRLLEPTYAAQVASSDRDALGLRANEQPVLYCTLTVGQDGWLTANLLGPLVINPITRQAKQIVLADSPYSTRHPVVALAESN